MALPTVFAARQAERPHFYCVDDSKRLDLKLRPETLN